MYPTIGEGDIVTVETGYNSSTIRTGDLNSSELGDIIVYNVIATGIANPQAMWIAHRAIEKYWKDGTWWFRTKGDNNPEADPWEVPDYFILGIVTRIDRSTRVSETSEKLNPSDRSALQPSISIPPEDIVVGLMASIAVAFMAVSKYKVRAETLKKGGYVLSCLGCYYFIAGRTFELVTTDGRMGIRKVADLTRGSCTLTGDWIMEPSIGKCRSYKPKRMEAVSSTVA